MSYAEGIFGDRETCGDTLIGEGCEQGRWYGFCTASDCAGMCRYVGQCLCLGCGSWRCCRRFDECGYLMPALWVFDARVNRHVLRPIVEGPSL